METIDPNLPDLSEYEAFNKAHAFEEKAGFGLSTLQKVDIVQFIKWRKSLNMYEVGGGKTVVSTAVSLMHGAQVTVVSMPPILLSGWARWLRQVSSNVLVYKGTPAVRKGFRLQDHRWVLMSHDILRRDFDRILKDLQGLEVDVIVDEAQIIKSAGSKTYTCVGLLSKNRRLQMLTGTPTSSPLDCYTYIRLKTPDLYRSLAHFRGVHVADVDFFGKITRWAELDTLAENFKQKAIARSKLEIHGYSNDPLYPDTVYDLAPDHYKLYEQLVEEQLLTLPDDSQIDATTATRMYHALQQLVVNYDHFSGDPSKRSASYDLIDDIIERTDCLNPAKSKLIIWTVYKLTSRSVLKYLKDKRIHAVGAYGEVDSNASFARFMEDPKCRVLVAQYQSAGAGLNPQSVCWESLFLELSTVPMYIKQALGRTDRMGQKHKPSMYLAVAANTIQQRLLDSLLDKDDLVAKVERTKSSLREALFGRKRP
jgi:hypothetical protein